MGEVTPRDRRRVRIFSLQSGDMLGGTELMTHRIISRLDRRRFEVEVCFLDNEGPLTPCYRSLGIKVWHLFADKRLSARAGLMLAKILRAERRDVLHAFGLRASLLGRIIARPAGVGHVVSGQQSVDAWRGSLHVMADRATSRLVDLYVANCHAAAERLRTKERIPREKLRVIHNGIDVAPFDIPVDREAVRRELGASVDSPIIVTVAELGEAKGHRYLLEAMARLRSQGQRCQLWLVGAGSLRGQLEERVRQLGIGDAVMFLGVRRDIPRILGAADIFCLSSLWEGLPGSIMEAMATRLPVVATTVGGIPEIITHGKTGILVPPRNPVALARALAGLLGDRTACADLGRSGRLRMEQDFRLDEKVKQLELTYDQLLSRVAEPVGLAVR